MQGAVCPHNKHCLPCVGGFTCAGRNTQGVLGKGVMPQQLIQEGPGHAAVLTVTEAHREEIRYKLAMAVRIPLMLPSFAVLPHRTFRELGFLARLRNGRRPNGHNNASLKTILHKASDNHRKQNEE